MRCGHAVQARLLRSATARGAQERARARSPRGSETPRLRERPRSDISSSSVLSERPPPVTWLRLNSHRHLDRRWGACVQQGSRARNELASAETPAWVASRGGRHSTPKHAREVPRNAPKWLPGGVGIAPLGTRQSAWAPLNRDNPVKREVMSSQPRSRASLEPLQRSSLRLLVTGRNRCARPRAAAPRGGRGPRARDARARGARPLRPIRGRRRRARRRWRPAPGDTDPLVRADLGSGRVARERSASRGGFDESSSTRRSRPVWRSTSSRPSRSSTRRTARCPRTRRSARSCRSCARRSSPSSRRSASRAPADAASSCDSGLLDGPGTGERPAEGRLRRHAARLRCRARAPLGALAAERHLQRLP